MKRNEINLYISKSVASMVRVCIDKCNNHDWTGRIYTRIHQEPILFQNIDELLSDLGMFWDSICFPQESTISRSFCERKSLPEELQKKLNIQVSYPEDGTKDKIRVELSEIDMEKKYGEQGTFIVKIRYRQNATWQGHVTWVEENKTVPFRSALELIKLIDSAQEKEAKDWNIEN